MKVVLEYTDCLQDGKNVFSILAANDVEILKSKKIYWSIEVLVTIRIKDGNELNKLIYELNRNCKHEVRVISVKFEDNFLERIKRIFE